MRKSVSFFMTLLVPALPFPKKITYCVIFLCLLPFVFLVLRDHSTYGHLSHLNQTVLKNISAPSLERLLYQHLSDAFLHTLLEWSAVCIAMLTLVLSCIHYRLTHNVFTVLMGLILFFSGCLDAFHILATDHLLPVVYSVPSFIPLTWALSRLFHALMLIIVVAILLWWPARTHLYTSRYMIGGSICFIGSIYGLLMCLVIFTDLLPFLEQIPFLPGWVARPYDLLPLLLYLIAGVWLYPWFYQRHPSFFSYALMLSMLPDIAIQMLMAFGSTQLFDDAFYMAHFLKVVAYATPLTGLLLDYSHTYQQQNQLLEQVQQESAMRQALEQEVLAISSREQQRIGHELHDTLGQQLTGIALLTESLKADLADKGVETDQIQSLSHIQTLLKDTIQKTRHLSRMLAMSEWEFQDLKQNLQKLLQDIQQCFGISCHLRIKGDLPLLTPEQHHHLYLMMQEGINNALKHGQAKDISLNIMSDDTQLIFNLQDNGQGFGHYQKPHPGLGLKIMQYRAKALGATLRIASPPGYGTCLTCVCPVVHP